MGLSNNHRTEGLKFSVVGFTAAFLTGTFLTVSGISHAEDALCATNSLVTPAVSGVGSTLSVTQTGAFCPDLPLTLTAVYPDGTRVDVASRAFDVIKENAKIASITFVPAIGTDHYEATVGKTFGLTITKP